MVPRRICGARVAVDPSQKGKIDMSPGDVVLRLHFGEALECVFKMVP